MNPPTLSNAVIRGQPKLVVTAWCGGRRKRQFFDPADEARAKKAIADAERQQVELGQAFKILSAAEKVEIVQFREWLLERYVSLTAAKEAIEKLPVIPKTALTLAKAIEGRMEQMRRDNCRPLYVASMQRYFDGFAKGREAAPVAGFTTTSLKEWLDSRKDDAPGSRNKWICVLSTLFDYCWREGHIPENLAKRLRMARIERKPPPVLTVDQCREAMAWTRQNRPKLLAWLTLTLFCGLRPESEADHLTWDAIDLERKRITLVRSKVREVIPRMIELDFCPPALAWLKVAEKEGGVLPFPKNLRDEPREALRNHLGFKSWPTDIFRHTAASNLLGFHQDAGPVAKFMGHSVSVLHRNYNNPVFKSDAEKWMGILP